MIKLNFFQEILNYPNECYHNTKLPKTTIYENAQLKTRDKAIFTETIEKIIWTYYLKPENLKIQPYHDETKDYSEVEILEVILRKNKKINRIADILLRTIPYPMILVFYYNNSIKIYTSHIREHGSDSSKITLEKIINTGWIDLNKQTILEKQLFEQLKIENLNNDNFYEFYNDIIKKIITYNASKLKGNEINEDSNKTKRTMEKIEKIENEILKIEKEIKKESNMGTIVSLNIKRHELNEKKKGLLNQLK